MRIAIPLNEDGAFCPHFGRCRAFYLCEVEVERRLVDRPRVISRTASGCDSLPAWLESLAVDTVVAGGIGAGAMQGLTERGIAVSAGHEAATPEQAVRSYFASPVGLTAEPCGSHEHDHHHCRHD